jgi:hypothetical protein
LQMLEKIRGDSGNIGNGGIKCRLIHFRRRPKSTDFPDKLERGGGYFVGSWRRFGPAEDFNAAAHISNQPLLCYSSRDGTRNGFVA